MQKLLNLDPNVRAIVSSGYSNDPVMANFSKYNFCAAVKKPYQMQDMARVLHTVVHAQPKKIRGKSLTIDETAKCR